MIKYTVIVTAALALLACSRAVNVTVYHPTGTIVVPAEASAEVTWSPPMPKKIERGCR